MKYDPFCLITCRQRISIPIGQKLGQPNSISHGFTDTVRFCIRFALNENKCLNSIVQRIIQPQQRRRRKTVLWSFIVYKTATCLFILHIGEIIYAIYWPLLPLNCNANERTIESQSQHLPTRATDQRFVPGFPPVFAFWIPSTEYLGLRASAKIFVHGNVSYRIL